MPEKNYYEILEISRSSGQELLDEHFRLMLYKYHPDHNQGNEDWAATQTIQLVEAYKTLSHPEERQKYDFKLMFRLREKGDTGGLGFLKKKSSLEAEKAFEEGVRLYNRDKKVPAAECFRKALQLDADFAAAAYNFALLAALLNNPHAGLDSLSKAIKAGAKDEDLVKLRNAITKTYLNM